MRFHVHWPADGHRLAFREWSGSSSLLALDLNAEDRAAVLRLPLRGGRICEGPDHAAPLLDQFQAHLATASPAELFVGVEREPSGARRAGEPTVLERLEGMRLLLQLLAERRYAERAQPVRALAEELAATDRLLERVEEIVGGVLPLPTSAGSVSCREDLRAILSAHRAAFGRRSAAAAMPRKPRDVVPGSHGESEALRFRTEEPRPLPEGAPEEGRVS